jgi:gamma-glutamylcysteine synthetase
MTQHPEQMDFGKKLRTLSERDLFSQMQATMEALHASSRFRGSDPRLLWQSRVLEEEISDRFPERGLDVFREWARQRP